MRQIPYNNSAATLVFEYPPNWDVTTITGVNITVKNLEGTDLLAATAATLYTATTLYSAASVGDNTITLTTGASATVPGYSYYIDNSTTGPPEIIVCRYFTTGTNPVVGLRESLREAHAASTAFRGMYCTYDLDTSTVATWTKGLQCTISWTPVGSDDLAVYERAELAVMAAGIRNLENRFRGFYPREYEVIDRLQVGDFESFSNEVMKNLEVKLSHRGVLLDRITDQEALAQLVIAAIRRQVTLAGGDKWETERATANEEFNILFNAFTEEPQWIDSDQDQIQDEDEVDDYAAAQLLDSERAI